MSLLSDPLSVLVLSIDCLACGLFAFVVVGMTTGKRAARTAMDALAWQRRECLRGKSWLYRSFEPVLDELARVNHAVISPLRIDELEHRLAMLEAGADWKAEEFVAYLQLQAGLAALVVGCLLTVFANVAVAFAVATIFGVLTYTVLSVSWGSEVAQRQREFKRRLPFAVDVMALMLDAGAELPRAIEAVAKENHGHPLGDELSRVASDLRFGRGQVEALTALDERMRDQDLSELIMAVRKAEELGTPLEITLLEQSEQMQLKRSQWGEKKAAEAEVSMTFPGMVIMIACMIVIVGPIVLPLITGNGLHLFAE